MARSRLRRFDVQAQWAFYLSCLSLVTMSGLVFLLFFRGNFNWELKVILYSRQSMYAPAVFVATALTLLLAGAGAAMGGNSAGQKRNNLTKRSWIAFFVGAATVSVTLILFAIFWFYKFAQ